jgi:hypothetical protein
MSAEFRAPVPPADSQSVDVNPPRPVPNNSRGNSRGRRPPSRGRFNVRSGQRHGGTGFAKDTTPSGSSLGLRQSYFSVATSNRGIQKLSEIVYDLIVARDRQITQLFPFHLFIYAISISFTYRLTRVASGLGYASPRDISRLKKAAENVLLPTIICNYIESIGLVTLRSGARVVPRCADTLIALLDLPEEADVEITDDSTDVEVPPAKRPRVDFDVDPELAPFAGIMNVDDPDGFYFDYRSIFAWAECNYVLPTNTVQHPNPWYVHEKMLIDYNLAMIRAQRTGARFRKVENSVTEGKSEMIVNYTDGSFDVGLTEFTPTAPEAILNSIGLLGATYRFRRNGQAWPVSSGNYLLKGQTFTGTPTNVDLDFSNITLASFGPPQDQH